MTTTAVPTHSHVRQLDEAVWTRLPRRGWSWVREQNRRLGVQPAGWVLFALVIVAFVAGGLLGWVELRIAAVAGLAVLLIAAAFMIGRQTYAVELSLANERVVVGERALGELRVVNTSEHRLLPARIELPVGRRLASFALPSLGGRASHDEVFAVPTSRRSVIRVGPARTVRGDPFLLMGREIWWTAAIDLFVHPQTVLLPGRPGGFIRDLEGHPTRDLSNSDVAFHALREYTSGDDRRYVHWRSTARTGKLMVRQFEETRRSHIAVGLDLGASAWGTDEEFELGVSVAGSIALQALRDENTLTLITTAGKLKAVSPRRTLDELCTVELESRGGPQAITRQVAFLEPHASVVAIVTGSTTRPLELRRACTLYEQSVKVVAVRVEAGAELSVQNIGNVSLITVGALDDLARAMRRAHA